MAWERRFERHGRLSRRAQDFAAAHSLGCFLARESWISPTVACLTVPAPLRGTALVEGLLGHGMRIANGYGELADRTIRIGHLGDCGEEEFGHLLAVFSGLLAAIGGS